jgi:vacuolar protein sorting-associated protein 26
MNFFVTNPTVAFTFSGQQSRARKLVRVPGADPVEQLIYNGTESVQGAVELSAPPGKKIEHQGIKIELIGQIELINDRLSTPTKICAMLKILDNPGILTSSKTYPFEFSGERPFETYSGINVRLRYFLKVTVTRSYSNYTREVDFSVELPQAPDEKVGNSGATSHLVSSAALNNPIKMEVGIEDCLHIEFEYDSSKYHLKDVILGKIYFLLVRINIKHMELAVIRRESAGATQSSTYTDSENITKYELMDGAPIKGECVPIRLFMEPLALTPTYRSVRNIFSVKYYLNLVLVDEEDRRYFKQNEITFWRCQDGVSGKPQDAPEASAQQRSL